MQPFQVSLIGIVTAGLTACASTPALTTTSEEIASDLRSSCASVFSNYKKTGLDSDTGKIVTDQKALHYITVVSDSVAAQSDAAVVTSEWERGEAYITNNAQRDQLVAQAIVSQERVSNCLRQRRLEQLAG